MSTRLAPFVTVVSSLTELFLVFFITSRIRVVFGSVARMLVSSAAVIRVVTGESLRDDPNNGCEGDYKNAVVN